ncbi:MAG: DEAD/DEAH box helicase [Spirochaetes bacterium]|nr:DEAD/DEAH box helicase [Spirochaetota bacterium]
MNFEELKIVPQLIEALKKMNIEKPTEIQVLSIGKIAGNHNAAIKSQTGTGKTLAYLLPLIKKLMSGEKDDQIIVLSPTHELASQINTVANDLFAKAGLPMKSLLLIGSTNISRQMDQLKKKPSILVGSPGRIAELITQKKIKAHKVKTIVFDEADRLLNDESLSQIKAMCKSFMRDIQMIFVSATMNDETLKVAGSLTQNIVSINAQTGQTPDNIEHIFFHTDDEREKFKILRKSINALNIEKALLFMNKNEDALKISERLIHHGINAADFHSAKDKLERQKTITDFRNGDIKILVVSDLAARGLDVSGLTHVINYNLPDDATQYLHRTGRTGRADKKGIAVTITAGREKKLLLSFAEKTGFVLKQKDIREGVVIDAI